MSIEPLDLIYDWNIHGESIPYHAVELVDETLRDGLQSPSLSQPRIQEKVYLLYLMSDLGIQSANVGIPATGEAVKHDCRVLARETSYRELKIRPQCAGRDTRVGVMRILLIADTHLGFDYAFRPRIVRRRRGVDFFRNFSKALERAVRDNVDCVIHGGDILYRSRVPARLVDMAFEPLHAVADKGIPVFVVPGNHERSNIPFRILAAHPHIHIFDEPRTFCLEKDGFQLALAGFPFVRHGIRKKFRQLVRTTGYHHVHAAGHVLCMHQSVDGCVMGPNDYMMRGGNDVVHIRDIPPSFCCALCGHMHRSQVVRTDLSGATVPVPVLYPGSIERTSFAEMDERKGYIIIELHKDTSGKAVLNRWSFHELPTRPMIRIEYNCSDQGAFQPWLQHRLSRLPRDSIVKIRVHGTVDRQLQKTITASSLRSMAPDTMNIQIALDMH